MRSEVNRPLRTADQGDGTYRNPVLRADWSDPDAVRVGRDFYLTASSFHRVPGLPILHSRDLVNWTLIGHALDRLEPAEAFAAPHRGSGVWAPAIRHHGGRFRIFYPDPDRGIFTVTAEDPAGPWSEPHLLKGGAGLIDPCPLWTPDGQAYLVHAWAKSRAGFNNRLTCHRMNEDGTELLDEGAVVVDGDAIDGYRTLEGPKFYAKDGWYWIFAPAGGVRDGWQSVFRSRDPLGPYEHRIVLEQGETDVNGPHQGAWVTTESGQDWFLHFQDRDAFGRVVHLQPMRWDADGWPVIGDPPGRPVASHPKPDTEEQVTAAPPAADEFEGVIGPQWAWAANPDPAWHEASTGRLTLACAPTDTGDLRQLPNLLEQRLPAEDFRAQTSVRLVSSAPKARTGLAVLGESYAWIGLHRTDDGAELVFRTAARGQAERDSAPPRAVRVDMEGTTTPVRLGVEVTGEGVCRFLAGIGTGPLEAVGLPFQATSAGWVGAALGLFATASGPGGGTADFGPVRICAAGDGRG